MARIGLDRPVRVFVLAVLGLGCSTTRYAGPAVTPESVGVIRGENPGAPVVVEGVVPPSADVPRASKLTLTLVETNPTETVVKEAWSSAQFSVKNQDIRGLTITDHARGALQGAAVGALSAALLVGVAVLANVGCDSCYVKVDPGSPAARVGIFVGIPLVLLTTGVGALVGARTTYTFQ
jgi:malate/lactate dehydrogenase